jgi:hypothetical protein
MTQDKIKNILENIDTNLHDEEYYAKEIYKLHLESQLELLHTINDNFHNLDYPIDIEEAIHNKCEELETKLKELE